VNFTFKLIFSLKKVILLYCIECVSTFFSTYSAVSELIRFKRFALTTYYIGRLRKNGTLENSVSYEGCPRFTWIFVLY